MFPKKPIGTGPGDSLEFVDRDHWYELQRRSAGIFDNVCHPVGRSAKKLVISGNRLRIAVIDEDTLRNPVGQFPQPRNAARRRKPRAP